MKRTWKKALIVWLISTVVCSSIWYGINETKSIGASLLFGYLIGLGMGGTYLYQHRTKVRGKSHGRLDRQQSKGKRNCGR